MSIAINSQVTQSSWYDRLVRMTADRLRRQQRQKQQRRWTVAIAVGLLCAVAVGCGYEDVFNFDERLDIVIYGSHSVGFSNSSAEGGASTNAGFSTPESLTLQLTGISAVDTNGVAVDWFERDALEITVLDRTQLIYSVELGQHVGKEFSDLSLHFAPQVSAAKAGLVGTLESTKLVLEQPFIVAKGKEARLTVRLPWRNLIHKASEGSSAQLAPVDLIPTLSN